MCLVPNKVNSIHLGKGEKQLVKIPFKPRRQKLRQNSDLRNFISRCK